MAINWKVLIPGFFIALFLIRYYDFFFLYLPVRTFIPGGYYEPSLLSFTLYNYTLKVFYYLLKFLVISATLSAGILLHGNDNDSKDISFGGLYLLAVLAEFVFLVADLIKIIDFSFFSVNYTDQEYVNSYPLSLFQLLEGDADSPFAYLLQSINIFEMFYILVLGYGLRHLKYPGADTGYKVAALSYGSLLVIAVAVLTYFKML